MFATCHPEAPKEVLHSEDVFGSSNNLSVNISKKKKCETLYRTLKKHPFLQQKASENKGSLMQLWFHAEPLTSIGTNLKGSLQWKMVLYGIVAKSPLFLRVHGC